MGLSTCPQGGSIFNERIWNTQKKAWEGKDVPRTGEGNEAAVPPSSCAFCT